jgi:hypothetical protein
MKQNIMAVGACGGGGFTPHVGKEADRWREEEVRDKISLQKQAHSDPITLISHHYLPIMHPIITSLD